MHVHMHARTGQGPGPGLGPGLWHGQNFILGSALKREFRDRDNTQHGAGAREWQAGQAHTDQQECDVQGGSNAHVPHR